MKTIFTTLALSATLAVPLSASAQVSASGTLNNFSYTLVDLLPNDGIAPSLSIVKPRYPDSNGTRAYADISQSGPNEVREIGEDRTRALYSRALDAGISVPEGSVVSTIGGTNFQSLDLRTAAATTRNAGHRRTAIASNFMIIDEFVLSPGTQIRFFADVNASTATTAANTNFLAQSSKVTAAMSFEGYLPSWYPDAHTEFELRAPYWNGSPLSHSASERLSIMFENTEAKTLNLKLSISLWAEANSFDTTPSTSPVPEPATYGMLLAGLALVGGVARRKRAG